MKEVVCNQISRLNLGGRRSDVTGRHSPGRTSSRSRPYKGLDGSAEDLRFSLEEFAGRLEKVREMLVQWRTGVFLRHTRENILYLTGYSAPGYHKYQTWIIALDKRPMMLTRHSEQPNVHEHSWIERSVAYPDIQDHVALTQQVLVKGGDGRKRIGVQKDSSLVTAKHVERLQAMMPEAAFEDCSGIVERTGFTRSPKEITYIEDAARTTEKTMQAPIDAVVQEAAEDRLGREVSRPLVAGPASGQVCGLLSPAVRAALFRTPPGLGECCRCEKSSCSKLGAASTDKARA